MSRHAQLPDPAPRRPWPRRAGDALSGALRQADRAPANALWDQLLASFERMRNREDLGRANTARRGAKLFRFSGSMLTQPSQLGFVHICPIPGEAPRGMDMARHASRFPIHHTRRVEGGGELQRKRYGPLPFDAS